MRRVACYLLTTLCLLLTLSSEAPETSAQAGDESDCQILYTVEAAPQTIIDSLSTIIAFNRDTNSYGFVGLSNYGDNLTELPASFDGEPILRTPLLSATGTKLLGIYGRNDALNSVLVVDLADGTRQAFNLDLRNTSTTQLSANWLDDHNVALFVYNSFENLLISKLIDTEDGAIMDIEFDYADDEILRPRYLPQLSPDLDHVAYVTSSIGFGDNLTIANLRTNEHTIVLSTHYSDDIRCFVWSPSGEYLAIAENPDSRNRPQRLVILDAAGEIRADVTLSYPRDYVFSQTSLRWSPNGDRLSFERGNPEPLIEIMSLDDLTITNTCLSGDALWSADGRLLAIFRRSLPTEASPGRITEISVYDTATDILYEVSEFSSDDIGILVGWAE